jgi:hypothetical protein
LIQLAGVVLAGIEGVERNAEEELQLLLRAGCSAPVPVPVPVPERPLRLGVVAAEASGE